MAPHLAVCGMRAVLAAGYVCATGEVRLNHIRARRAGKKSLEVKKEVKYEDIHRRSSFLTSVFHVGVGAEC